MADVIVDVLGEAAVAAAIEEINAFRDETQEAAETAIEQVASLLPFKTVPGTGSALKRIRDLLIDADVDLPDRLTIRFYFRDSVGGGRVQFIIAKIEGAPGSEVLTNVIALSNAGGALNPASIDDGTPTGWLPMEMKAVGNGLLTRNGGETPIAGGEVLAAYMQDFGDGSTYGTSAEISIADGELELSRVRLSPPETRALSPIISAAIIADKERSPAFVATVDDSFLHRVVRGCAVVGGEPDHDYGISSFERIGARVRIRIRDFTAGYDVAQGEITVSPSIDYPNLKPYLLCHSPVTNFTTYTGIMVFLDMDWTAFETGATLTYASHALAGFARACTVTMDEAANFIVQGRGDIILHPEPGDLTLQDEIDTLLFEPHAPTDPNFSLSQVAHPRRVPIFEMDRGDYGCRNTAFPPWVRLRGKGRGEGGTRILNCGDAPETGNAAHITQMPFSIWCEDIEFETDIGTGAYAIHIDEGGSRLKADTASEGGGRQRFGCFQRFDRCGFTAGPTALSAALGMGAGSGQVSIFNQAIFRSLSRGSLGALRPSFAMHSTPSQALPCRLEFHDCHHEDTLKKGSASTLFFQGLCSGQRNSVILNGGSAWLALVLGGWSSTGVIPDLVEDLIYEMTVSGSPNHPVAIQDGRASVLQVPIGATVVESTPLLFKGLYPWGQGKAVVADSESYLTCSLGKRLGLLPDYSVTVNGVTWTADIARDYRSDSNATIVAAMNAVLGAGVISVARADPYFYPDIGHKRAVVNGSGADFTRAHKGYALTLIPGSNTEVRLADGDDPVDGWLLRPGDDDDYVVMVGAPAIASIYVAGATVDGDFRIVNGVPTFSGVTASNRKGRVVGAAGQACGVVTLY